MGLVRGSWTGHWPPPLHPVTWVLCSEVIKSSPASVRDNLLNTNAGSYPRSLLHSSFLQVNLVLTNAHKTWFKVSQPPSSLTYAVTIPGWNLGFCLGPCGTWWWGRGGGQRRGSYVPLLIHKAGSVVFSYLMGCWEEAMNGAWGGLSTVPDTSPSFRA